MCQHTQDIILRSKQNVRTQIDKKNDLRYIGYLLLTFIGGFFSCHASIADTVTVDVFNAATKQPLKSLLITAEEISDNGTIWYSEKQTDNEGQAIFELPFEQKQRYRFKVRAYNNSVAYSDTAHQNTPSIAFPIGTTRLTLIDGSQAADHAYANKKVDIQRQNSDGTYSWWGKVLTDNKGLLQLDLPNLSSDQNYKVIAKHALNSKAITLPAIQEPGTYTMRVGNPLARITLVNAVNRTPLKNQNVNIFRQSFSGDRTFYQSSLTDNDGVIDLELPGLGTQYFYQLETAISDGSLSLSHTLTRPESHTWTLGRHKVLVSSNNEATTLNQHPIVLLRKNLDSYQPIATLKTNQQGWLTVDLPSNSLNDEYKLETYSPNDKLAKYSLVLSHEHLQHLKVGAPKVSISVFNTAHNKPAKQIISIYRKESSHWQWFASRQTDTQGKLSIELPGINAGHSYQLRTKLLNRDVIYHQAIDKAQHYDWFLDNMRVRVMNASLPPGNKMPLLTPLQEQLISIYNTDGDFIQNMHTNDNGWLYFDSSFPTPFQLQTFSPSNIKIEHKKTINKSQPEQYFTLASTPLKVYVEHVHTASPLPKTPLIIQKQRHDGTYKNIEKRLSDDKGQALFLINEGDQEAIYRIKALSQSNLPVYSDPIKPYENANLEMKLGSIHLVLKDGSSDSRKPLANYPVWIHYQSADSQQVTNVSAATTTSTGELSLDLPNSKQKHYIISARNPASNNLRYTDRLKPNTSSDFIIGNPLVQVNLKSAVNNKTISHQKVTVLSKNPNGHWEWFDEANTNEHGYVNFDLPDLNSDRQYRLRTTVLSTGTSYSSPLKQYGNFPFLIGKTSIELVDNDSGRKLKNITVQAFRLDKQNQLKWEKQGQTDSNGQIAFDLLHLDNGARYVLAALNPYQQKHTYYSSSITTFGNVDLLISRSNAYQTLDLSSPSISMHAQKTHNISRLGFSISGSTRDNRSTPNISIQVDNNKGVVQTFTALITDNKNTWQAFIPTDWLTPGDTITITATAKDEMLNATSVTNTYIINDDFATLIPNSREMDARRKVKKADLLAMNTLQH